MTFSQWKELLHLKLYLCLRKTVVHKMDIHTNFTDLTQAIKPALVKGRLLSPTHTFDTLGANAGETIQFLRQVNLRLQREVNTAELLADLKTSRVNAANFFVSQDGYYIDAYGACADLKEQLHKYADFIQKHHKVDDYGITAHNVRILQPTTEKLFALTDQLVRYLAN